VPADLAQVTILAREAEHRAKNVLATVRPSQSDTPKGLKQTIERHPGARKCPYVVRAVALDGSSASHCRQN
jgi:hypothetical protein